jgi:hypothetical protein
MVKRGKYSSPNHTRSVFLDRSDKVPFLIYCLGYIESSQDGRDCDEQGVGDKMASRAHPPTEAKSYIGGLDFGIKLAILQESLRVETPYVWAVDLFIVQHGPSSSLLGSICALRVKVFTKCFRSQ